MTTITAVVPWLNHMEHAKDFWKAMACANIDVLVIDNGSSPPLPNAHRLEENVGFTRACNIGLGLARTDAVLFLNNDIEATHTGWIEPLREALEPGVLVGAQLRYDAHGAANGQPLPYLDGWCIAGMTEDLLDLGGFDETLDEPAYYSDNLLCLEARAYGMSLREARVGLRHKLNGSTNPQDERTVRATVANQRRFLDRAAELMGVAA